MGLFDNGGFFGYEPTDADRQQALYQGLLGLGAQLTASGAPTLTPGGNSHHMANAGNAFNQGMTGYLNHQKMGHQQKQQSQMQNIMAGLEMKKHQVAMAQQKAQQDAMASISPEEQRNATLGGEHYWKARFAQPQQQATFETVQSPYGRGGVGQRDSISGKIVNYHGPPKPSEQPGGHFAGNGMAAQAYNTLMLVGPKIANGTATPKEQQAYGLAYQHVSRPQRYTTPEGTFETPGMDLAAFPTLGGADHGGPTQVGGPKISDAQHTAKGFGDRMAEAHKIINELKGLGAELEGSITGSEYWPNALKSEDRQRLEQAQRNFVNSILRRESGAVISNTEFENAARQYFPQPGDGPAVMAQKAKNRETAIQSILNAAGPANKDVSINLPTAPIQGRQAKGTDLPPGFELVED